MVACYLGVDATFDLLPEHRAALLTHDRWDTVHFRQVALPDDPDLSSLLDVVKRKVSPLPPPPVRSPSRPPSRPPSPAVAKKPSKEPPVLAKPPHSRRGSALSDKIDLGTVKFRLWSAELKATDDKILIFLDKKVERSSSVQVVAEALNTEQKNEVQGMIALCMNFFELGKVA